MVRSFPLNLASSEPTNTVIKDKVILLISPEPWGQNFVSKHHYAHYLSKNNKVYFLNPAKGFSKVPMTSMKVGINEVETNLLTVDYLNLLPRLNYLPKSVQASTYRKQSAAIQKAISDKIDLVWSFDPHRYWDQSVWNADASIYHTVDFHPGAKYEEKIVASSTLFLGVTELILNEHKRKGHLIMHAADVDGFKNIKNRELPGLNTIKACYVGNFHKHIDYDVLQQLAKENSDCDFIMIGPIADSNLSAGNKIGQRDFNDLSSLKNVFFLGSIPANELMSIISRCQINLVLFKKEFEQIHCSPHKLMGYFYTGNVTISNYIDAHKNTDKDIISMVEDLEKTPAFFKEVKTKLAHFNSPEKRQKRIEFAIQNSYASKIEQIGKLLEDATDSKAFIPNNNG